MTEGGYLKTKKKPKGSQVTQMGPDTAKLDQREANRRKPSLPALKCILYLLLETLDLLALLLHLVSELALLLSVGSDIEGL